MRTRYFFSGFVLAAMSGCVSVPVVESARGVPPLSITSMRCHKPYLFTQDCNDRWLARRLIRIDSVDAAVSSTQDQTTILVMDGHAFRNMMLEFPLVLNSPRHSRAANAAYDAVSKHLTNNGISIKRVIPIVTMTDIYGYVFELESPGYELLRAHTVE